MKRLIGSLFVWLIFLPAFSEAYNPLHGFLQWCIMLPAASYSESNFLSQDWQTYQGKDSFALYQKAISDQGFDGTAYYRIKDGNGNINIEVIADKSPTYADLDKLLETLKAILGKPDWSDIKENAKNGQINLIHQAIYYWYNNGIAVTMDKSGYVDASKEVPVGMALIEIGPTISKRVFVDDIILKLIFDIGSNPPSILVLDVNSNKVYNQNGAYLCSLSISDGSYSFDFGKDHNRLHFEISRYSGTFTMKGKDTSLITGKCEKVTSQIF